MHSRILQSRPHLIPALIAAIMLVAALADWPYGYYQLLRFVTCGVAAYIAYLAYLRQKMWAAWLFGLIAVLFNPLIPIHLRREAWAAIDCASALVFVLGVFVLEKPQERTDKSMEMTIPEAEEIVDIVSRALQAKNPNELSPMSLLKGYDVPEIDAALKLSIANKFLYLSGDPASENRFGEFVRAASAVSFAIPTFFVPDERLAELDKLPVGSREYMREKMKIEWSSLPLDEAMNFKDERLGSLETPSSFADYCKQLGTEDPLYWQKVYTRIGLEYTAKSPRRNVPVWLD